MNLEEVEAVIRPRSPWEAVDLGLALTRRHYAKLAALWGSTVLPVWGLILALFFWAPLLGLLVVVWVKPLLTKVPLYYLSRALFGERLSLREMWRLTPQIWCNGLWRDLGFGRFSLQRGLLAPVDLLEGLTGERRRQRLALLKMTSGSTGAILTLKASLFVLVVTFGILFFVMGVLPGGMGFDWAQSLEDFRMEWGPLPEGMLWTLIIGYILGLSFFELFYIGAGFGLYLNTRTVLEGWDIDLAFRRLGERLEVMDDGKKPLRLKSKVAASEVGEPEVLSPPRQAEGGLGKRLHLLILGGVMFGVLAGAEGVAKVEDPKMEIKEILADSDFEVQTKTVREPSFKESQSIDGGWSLSLLPGLMKILFFGGLLVGLGALIYFLIRSGFWQGLGGYKERRKSVATSVMGLNVSPESLPDEIVDEARKLWQRGEVKRAIALLYRGALSYFIYQAGVEIRDSDTEGDCMRLVRLASNASEEASVYFARLTGLRVRVAYADEMPDEAEMSAIFEDWCFDRAGRAERGLALVSSATKPVAGGEGVER